MLNLAHAAWSRVFAVFVVGVALFAVSCTPAPAPSSPTAASPGDATVKGEPVLTVYYFHRTLRCPSCIAIEAMAKEAVEEGFPVEVGSGRIVWKAVNVDEPADAHYDEDYGLSTQSVVLSDTRGGVEVRWKNLEAVWDLLDDREKFLEYVRLEVREFLSDAVETAKEPEK